MELVIYRHPFKQSKKAIKLVINDSLLSEFQLGSFLELKFRATSKPIKVCVEGESNNCLLVNLDSYSVKYIECVVEKKSGEIRISEPSKQEVKYKLGWAISAQEQRIRKEKRDDNK
jgi:hypothetical protein